MQQREQQFDQEMEQVRQMQEDHMHQFEEQCKKAEESISKTMDQPNSHSNNHQWLAGRAAVELWPVVSQNGTARHLDHGSQLAMRVLTVAGQ